MTKKYMTKRFMLAVFCSFAISLLIGIVTLNALLGGAAPVDTQKNGDFAYVYFNKPLNGSYSVYQNEALQLDVDITADISQANIDAGVNVHYENWTWYENDKIVFQTTSSSEGWCYYPETQNVGINKYRVEVEYTVFQKQGSTILGDIIGYLDSGKEVSSTVVSVDVPLDHTPVISYHPSSASIVLNDTNTFSVGAYSKAGDSLKYQWYKQASGEEAVAISGATGSSYVYRADDTTSYAFYAEVYADYNGQIFKVTSNKAELVVNNPIVDYYPSVEQPHVDGSSEIEYGKAFVITANASETSGKGTISYQWYSNTMDYNENGTIINGATSNTLSLDGKNIGTTYYYVKVVNNVEGITWSNTSKATAITIKAPERVEIGDVEISFDNKTDENQDVNKNNEIQANAGDEVILKANATPSQGATLGYQWYSVQDGDSVAYDGETSDSFKVPTAVESTRMYFVRITNKLDENDKNLWFDTDSKIFTVTVKEKEVNAEEPGETNPPGTTNPNEPGESNPNVPSQPPTGDPGPSSPAGEGTEAQAMDIGQYLPWVVVGSAIIAVAVGIGYVQLKKPKNSTAVRPMNGGYANPNMGNFGQNNFNKTNTTRSNTSRTANKYLNKK